MRSIALLLFCVSAAAGDLVYVGLNAQGAEEWLRVKDSALVIRVPGGEYLRREYEGAAAVEEPKPFGVASFFVDKHEVTNARFARFLNERRGQEAGLSVETVPGLERKDGVWTASPGLENHPVTAATGRGALAYAEWAGARMPAQPEWEKAAGGAEGRLYPWGDKEPDVTLANFGRPAPRGPEPVGSHPSGASPYGCLDMAGNVYDRVMVPKRGPVMVKGGSWLSPHPLNLRVLDLCMQPLEVAERSVGFRCAMDDPEPERPLHPPAAPPALRLARSFEAAVAEARERRVPIFLTLLYDTCGQCDRTREQLYKDPRFVAYCNEKLVVALGHQPGHASMEPHPPNEDGSCPLYA
ncbi:MAG: SUMF1/EgtB/PvdO family nonheme iron enzyme, partial [Planctomycetota bacterium]